MSSALPAHLLLKAAAVFIVCGALTACAASRAEFTATQAVNAQLPGFSHIREFADTTVANLKMDPAKVNPQQGFVFLALSGGGAERFVRVRFAPCASRYL
jgi:hypothetical protein